jgi:hypothetical protein
MKVKIVSGEYAGRFVGPHYMGLRTNPALLANPEVPVPGTPYYLFAQEAAATGYPQARAEQVQAELKAVGVESELV